MNVTRTLRDLYAQKRWLNGVIGALEIASRSPEGRFTAMLASKLCHGSRVGPLVGLRRQKKAEITRLANLIRGSRHTPRLAARPPARVLPFRVERNQK